MFLMFVGLAVLGRGRNSSPTSAAVISKELMQNIFSRLEKIVINLMHSRTFRHGFYIRHFSNPQRKNVPRASHSIAVHLSGLERL